MPPVQRHRLVKLTAGLLVLAMLLPTGGRHHLLLHGAAAFSTSSSSAASAGSTITRATLPCPSRYGGTSRLYEQAPQEVETTAAATAIKGSGGSNQDRQLYILLSLDEMVRQVSSAMEDAKAKGINRQIVRVLLPRSADNDQLLQYYEQNVASPDGGGVAAGLETVLVPPDETWQGGIMQLYRAASLAASEILRRYSRNASGGVVPRLQEDRSFDESGVDGIGLWMAQGAAPGDDVSCFVQPSQETVDAIESISDQAGDRLVALLNPQWRIVDDALDTASRSEGALGMFASFLGGKGNSLRRLESLGFEATFVLEGYVCRGGNVRMVKRFDTDYAVFAENDAGTDYIQVGTATSRPTYQDVDEMLQEKGIGLKYARDIGLAPKL